MTDLTTQSMAMGWMARLGRGAASAVLVGCLFLGGAGSAAAQSAPTGWWGVFAPEGGVLFDNSTGDAHREPPPLNGEYAERYNDVLAKVRGGEPIADTTALCLPSGLPRVWFEQEPLEIFVTPEKTWIVHQHNRQVRRIYTDGSSLPEDPDLSFNGTSVGRWEGDTLVVETVGLRDDTGIDRLTPHSDQMRVLERIRLRDADTLEADITVHDPAALTREWNTVRLYKRQPGGRVEQSDCEGRQSEALAALADDQ